MRPFAVMAKPVGPRCNLRCGYCYYSKAGHAEDGRAPSRMAEKTLELFIRQYIEASPGPVVNFTWHGGEPTLAGLDFYRTAVEIQKHYLPADWVCWNNIQTNGTLLDDDWCAFLADARFDVGLSIDGTRELHDRYRKDPWGRGAYQSAADAVHRLRAHGIRPDLLCVVTSGAADDASGVYRALREFDTGWIQFIPILRRGPGGEVTPDSVTADGYGDFLCTVFDEWSRSDIGRLNVQLFAETMRVWTGGAAGLCWMAPTCGRALIVERDGEVYSCDHYVNSAHRIGNIEDTPLIELADLPAQLRFGEEKRDSLPAQCRECPWLAACNGGCPKDRFALPERGEPGLNYLCSGLKRFFSYTRPMMDLITQLAKSGRTPEEVMAGLRADRLAKWRGVGRNDPCPCGSGRKAKHCCWPRRP